MFNEYKSKPVNARSNKEQLNVIYKKIMNQEMFKYPGRLVPRYFFKCLCCIKTTKSMKRKSMEVTYMRKGEKKMQEDMDFVRIIRMLHNVDIMQSVLFNRF